MKKAITTAIVILVLGGGLAIWALSRLPKDWANARATEARVDAQDRTAGSLIQVGEGRLKTQTSDMDYAIAREPKTGDCFLLIARGPALQLKAAACE